MQICVATDHFYPDIMGGSGRVAYELSRLLAVKGHQVTIITRRWKPEHPESEIIDNMTIFRYTPESNNPIRLTSSVKKSVREFFCRTYGNAMPDYIHIHQPLAALGLLSHIKKSKIPSIYFFYSPWVLEYISGKGSGESRSLSEFIRSLFLKSIERAAIKICGKIMVLSRFSEDQFKEWHVHKDKTITRASIGVNLDHFNPGHGMVKSREQLKLPLDKKIIFSVRNLKPKMGLEDLLEALIRLVDEDKNILLIIAGKGSHEQALKSLASKWGLEDYVFFIGFIGEDILPDYYRASDLFVLPNSEREGFGLVIAEALACGTPAVGTPTGAVPEILFSLEPKLLCPSTGAEAIYATIHNFFRIKRTREEWSGLCRAYAESRFSWDKLLQEII